MKLYGIPPGESQYESTTFMCGISWWVDTVSHYVTPGMSQISYWLYVYGSQYKLENLSLSDGKVDETFGIPPGESLYESTALSAWGNLVSSYSIPLCDS